MVSVIGENKSHFVHNHYALDEVLVFFEQRSSRGSGSELSPLASIVVVIV